MSLIHKIPKTLVKCFTFLPTDLDLRTRRLILQYVVGLLLCFHRKNATNIGALYGKHKSSYTRLLQQRGPAAKGWIHEASDELLRRGIPIIPGTRLYLIIDTTFKAKRGKQMGNLKKFRLSSQGPYFWGHGFVFAIVYYNGWRIPVAVKPYLSKEYCQKRRKKFYTQVDLAQPIIAEFTPVAGLHTMVLFDSFFCADKVLQEINRSHWHYASVLDRNRVITSLRGHPHISQRIERLVKTKGAFTKTAFTHEGRKKQYFMRREVLTISKVGEVAVVFSGKQKIVKKIKALVSHWTARSAVEISKHYSYRWFIECFFKLLKQYLGLGDYQYRSVTAQAQHVQFVVLAYLTRLRFYVVTHRAQGSARKRLAAPNSFKQLLVECRRQVEAENLQLVERKLRSKHGVRFLRRVYKTLRKKIA